MHEPEPFAPSRDLISSPDNARDALNKLLDLLAREMAKRIYAERCRRAQSAQSEVTVGFNVKVET